MKPTIVWLTGYRDYWEGEPRTTEHVHPDDRKEWLRGWRDAEAEAAQINEMFPIKLPTCELEVIHARS
jgi:ribosome modulation factor